MIFLAIMAVGIARQTNLFAAVMLTGIFSLLSAAVFVVLDAVDVAFTEAAVGAGITTVLMLATLSRTAHQHVAPRYINDSPTEVGVPNMVTSVLASYRGYDTLGEVTVIFTAGIGVLALIGSVRRTSRNSQRDGQRDEARDADRTTASGD
jgi:multicomponent Na+:H+ antiporter subunit B